MPYDDYSDDSVPSGLEAAYGGSYDQCSPYFGFRQNFEPLISRYEAHIETGVVDVEVLGLHAPKLWDGGRHNSRHLFFGAMDGFVRECIKSAQEALLPPRDLREPGSDGPNFGMADIDAARGTKNFERYCNAVIAYDESHGHTLDDATIQRPGLTRTADGILERNPGSNDLPTQTRR